MKSEQLCSSVSLLAQRIPNPYSMIKTLLIWGLALQKYSKPRGNLSITHKHANHSQTCQSLTYLSCCLGQSSINGTWPACVGFVCFFILSCFLLTYLCRTECGFKKATASQKERESKRDRRGGRTIWLSRYDFFILVFISSSSLSKLILGQKRHHIQCFSNVRMWTLMWTNCAKPLHVNIQVNISSWTIYTIITFSLNII